MPDIALVPTPKGVFWVQTATEQRLRTLTKTKLFQMQIYTIVNPPLPLMPEGRKGAIFLNK